MSVKIMSTWEEAFAEYEKKHNTGPGFCPDCGNLVPLTSKSESRCIFCKKLVDISSWGKQERVNKITPNVGIRDLIVKKKEATNKAIVTQACPECEHNKMYYHTAQLRSVDEGQTVFYECVNCGFKFSQNT